MNAILKIFAFASSSVWLTGFGTGLFMDNEVKINTTLPNDIVVVDTIVEPDLVTEEMVVNKSINVLKQYCKELGYAVDEKFIPMDNSEIGTSFTYKKQENNTHHVTCVTRLTKGKENYQVSVDIRYNFDLSKYTLRGGDITGNGFTLK